MNKARFSIVILSFFICLFAFSEDPEGIPADSPFSGQNPRPEIEIFTQPDILPSDKPGEVIFRFHIPDNYHLTKIEEYFFVKPLDQGINWGEIQYPESDGTLAGFPIYSSTVDLILPVFPVDLSGEYRMEFEVGWQMCEDDGVCLFPEVEQFDASIVFSVDQENFDWSFWLFPLVFALLGGLLLNVMPCVLPILSLKIFTLMKDAHKEDKEVSRNLWATVAGIIFSMMVFAVLIIALKQAGQLIGWGFHFQNLYYIIILSTVLFALALSLFGVFDVAVPGIAGAKGDSWQGHFFNGIILVLVSTPCTAPFMGTAMGFAFSAPWFMVLVIFLLLGLGLSIPLILLAVYPKLVKYFPKPGAWMETVKQLLGFFLLGTAMWLSTLVVPQAGTGFLYSFYVFWLLLSLMLWIMGKLQYNNSGKVRVISWISFVILFIALFTFFFIDFEADSSGSGYSAVQSELEDNKISDKWSEYWEDFSESKVQEVLDSGKMAFIDFTADWCVTCVINEATVLNTDVFIETARENDVVLIKGDYTLYDPVITSWLQRYQRAGVPFYLIMSADGRYHLFPELLSMDDVLNKLMGNF